MLSLVAPVVNTNVPEPDVVGVPVTVQLIDAPTATVPAVGTVGLQVALKPAGKLIAQVAPAVAGAMPLLVQVNLP